jgi:tRNA A-37 threonylcarbamoyl transferase component Bud32
MDTMKVCAGCGAPLAADAPQGLCPQCLLKQGLDTRPATTAASGLASFVAPLPADLARHFPQLDVLELMGQGGMGAVYKARQKGLDRVVALKILPPAAGRDPAFAERFTREARALARLNHPNIVTVHDFGQAAEYFYFLMEYVDGANLRQGIRARTLQPREALAIIPQICEALQYAHDEGIVHRDIKPENILLDRRGRVKIADFGLAKLLGRSTADFTLTGAQQVMGTPHYMAPEQFEKPLEVDHRADIYALGVVLYEMLTGEVPMGAFAPPSQKVQIDVRLDEVVLRTLAREPERRYQKVSQLQTDVENIAGIVANLPANVRRALGFEFRSKATLFGLPLVHIATGTDPVTGRRRVAKGIVAFGDIAKGVIAFGGIAMGGLTFGGITMGVVPIGGLGFGLFPFAGMAVGLVLGYGGVVVAPIAIGGLAVGWYAVGGTALAVHALGSHARDPVAKEFFKHWSGPGLLYGSLALMLVMTLISMLVPWLVQRRLLKKEQAQA